MNIIKRFEFVQVFTLASLLNVDGCHSRPAQYSLQPAIQRRQYFNPDYDVYDYPSSVKHNDLYFNELEQLEPDQTTYDDNISPNNINFDDNLPIYFDNNDRASYPTNPHLNAAYNHQGQFA